MKKISAIRQACKINSEALAETLKNFSELKTEKDFANFLNRELKKRGAKLAFPTIVAAGRNAFELHHKPTKMKISHGFLLVDFGAKMAGYCSDMARTFFVGGPSKQERQLYELVRTAHARCLRLARAGMLCSKIDHCAVLSLGKYSPTFKHAVGHGVGKKVHDRPAIYSRSCDVLTAGDVIAIEPGIYIKGKLGIRIEDTVLVRKNGCEVLTKFTKKLACLKR